MSEAAALLRFQRTAPMVKRALDASPLAEGRRFAFVFDTRSELFRVAGDLEDVPVNADGLGAVVMPIEQLPGLARDLASALPDPTALDVARATAPVPAGMLRVLRRARVARVPAARAARWTLLVRQGARRLRRESLAGEAPAHGARRERRERRPRDRAPVVGPLA